MRNISTNISALGRRTHPELGEPFSLFIVYNITIFWLCPLHSFWFYILLRDSAHTIYGELSTGHCVRGAPTNSLKKSLTTCNIDHKSWSDLAVCWPCGPTASHNSPGCCPVRSGEKKLTQRQETDRRGRPSLLPPPHQTLLCPVDTARDPVSTASVWSSTSVTAVDDNVDKLHKSSFAKPSHGY